MANFKLKLLIHELIEVPKRYKPGKGFVGGNLPQPHLGARCHRYRCSLPGLAEFTANRREGTETGHHNEAGDYPDFSPALQAESGQYFVLYLSEGCRSV